MLSPFLICLALITGFLAQDQSPKKTEPVATPAETVVVSGRVVYEDTGTPATRHRVQLIVAEALGNARNGLRLPTAITDERGEFSMRHVSAGEYYAYAEPIDQRGGNQGLTLILTLSRDDPADARRLDQFKKNNPKVTVVDGQRNIEINLRVPNPHFGSLSGIVFDATHQPAAKAQVRVASKAAESFALSVRTDDQGRYKVRGLPKGEYVVSASPPPKQTGDEQRNKNLQGSAGATYYPSTSLLANSPAVVVLPDVDTANVDVTLISRTLRNLAGTLKMRGDNRPITNGALRLTVKQLADAGPDTPRASAAESLMSSYSSSTDNSGRWSFANVPDGSYRLYIQPSGPAPTVRFVPIEQDITVNGNDIEDLSIEVSEGARLSGIVTLEGSGDPPQNITISAMAHTPPVHATGTVDEAGKFTLTAVPFGQIAVTAFIVPDNKFYVKSMEANGLDLLRNDITIAEGDDIKDVRVVLSSGVGVVTGRVLAQAGDKPLAGINVLLYRTAKDKLRLAGGRLNGVTDEHGNFSLSAVPGNYLVIAWRSGDGPGAYGAAMNKAVREQGEGGIALSANERKQLDIRLP